MVDVILVNLIRWDIFNRVQCLPKEKDRFVSKSIDYQNTMTKPVIRIRGILRYRQISLYMGGTERDILKTMAPKITDYGIKLMIVFVNTAR